MNFQEQGKVPEMKPPAFLELAPSSSMTPPQPFSAAQYGPLVRERTTEHGLREGPPTLISPGTLGNTSLTFTVPVSPNKEILPVFAYSTLQPLSQFWKLFLIYGSLSSGCHPACQLCLKANAK